MRITLGRVKMNKNGTCRTGYVVKRGGKSRRKSCVKRSSLGSRGRSRKSRRMGKK